MLEILSLYWLTYRYKPSSAFASSLCAIKLSLVYFWSSSIFFLLTKASSICDESI